MGNQNVKVFYKVQFDVEEKESDKDNPKFIRLYFSYEHDEEIGDRIVVGSIGGHKVSAATRHKH